MRPWRIKSGNFYYKICRFIIFRCIYLYSGGWDGVYKKSDLVLIFKIKFTQKIAVGF